MAGERISQLSVASSIAAADVLPITQGFTGANTGTTRLVSVARLGYGFNVKTYGATGDGITDDTAAVRAAANAIPATGGTLYIPAGTYSIAAPIQIKSNTKVIGDGAGSVLTASAAWVAPATSEYEFFRNVNYTGTPGIYLDQNISFEDLTFTYVNLQTVPNGGNHAIRFRRAKNITVRKCGFYYGNDAVAFLACKDTLIEGCYAFDNSNCAYDHWDNPQNARIIGCYAESAQWVQAISFNALGDGTDTGPWVANSCVIEGNTLIHKSGSSRLYTIINIYTLDPNATVRNVVIAGNVLSGIGIRGVGGCQNITVAGNIIDNLADVPAAIAFFGDGTQTPSNVTVSNNTINNPGTGTTELAVVRIWSNGYTITGNVISGTGYAALNVDTSTFVGVIVGNDFSQGVSGRGSNTSNAVISSTDAVMANGKSIGIRDASGALVRFTVQADNNCVMYSTDATGAQNSVFSWTARTNSPALNVVNGLLVGGTAHSTGVLIGDAGVQSGKGIGAFGTAAATTKPIITGSKGGNAALASLITMFATAGFLTDSTTA